LTKASLSKGSLSIPTMRSRCEADFRRGCARIIGWSCELPARASNRAENVCSLYHQAGSLDTRAISAIFTARCCRLAARARTIIFEPSSIGDDGATYDGPVSPDDYRREVSRYSSSGFRA